MEISDQVNLTIIGDEVGQIKLLKSDSLDFSNSEETLVYGGISSESFPLEDKAFFKLIAE